MIGDRIGDRIGCRRPILSPIIHKSPSGYGPLVEDLRFSEVGWGWYVGILGWGSEYKFSPLRIDNTGAWQISRFLELISN